MNPPAANHPPPAADQHPPAAADHPPPPAADHPPPAAANHPPPPSTDHHPPPPAADWEDLFERARNAARNAYAPYSRYYVGAAGLVDDGRIVIGCNVENASYGLTLCAECALVCDLHNSGGGRLLAVAVVSGSDLSALRPGKPCGRCRQVLYEAGGGSLMINERYDLAEILPDAFGPDDLK